MMLLSPLDCPLSLKTANMEIPVYIFTEPRVGYRMPKGEGQGPEVVNVRMS